MARVLLLALALAGLSLSADGQTADAGYENALSPSLAGVAKAMHATIRRNLAEAAENMHGRGVCLSADASGAHVRSARWPCHQCQLLLLLASNWREATINKQL